MMTLYDIGVREDITNMIKVQVNRKKWFRGQQEGSRLLLMNGKMCCIGFLARELRFKPKNIRNVTTLCSVSSDRAYNFVDAHEDALSQAYVVNDQPDIDNVTREKELKKVGERMGVQFIFKG